MQSQTLQVLKLLWPSPRETSDCFFWIFRTNYFRWVVECEDLARTRSHKSGHFEVIVKALIAFAFNCVPSCPHVFIQIVLVKGTWLFAFCRPISGHNIFSAFSRPFLPGYHAHMWKNKKNKKTCTMLLHSQELLQMFQHDWWCFSLWWLSTEAWTPDCCFFIVTLFYVFIFVIQAPINVSSLCMKYVTRCAQNMGHCRDGGFTAEQFQERECPQMQYPFAPPSLLSCQFVSPLVHSRQD